MSDYERTEEEWRGVPASTRSYLRLKGVDVPIFGPGPRKGFKQSLEHIAKRKRTGESHYNWKGNNIQIKSGRSRAIRKYQSPESCQKCNKISRLDRHHIDANTANNDIKNIMFLCRKCHMEIDGRLNELKETGKENLPKMRILAAIKRKQKTECPKGHSYSGSNLYVNKNGSRSCRKCLNDYKRAKRS